MILTTRLLTLAALAVVASAVSVQLVPPALRGVPDSVSEDTPDLKGRLTDIDTIDSTAQIVEQKDGPTADSPPNQPISDTVVTAVDGELTEAGAATPSNSTSNGRRTLPKKRRAVSDYNLVFSGTGTRSTDRDASIQGTAYLTFRVIDNSTYNVDTCLDFCSSEPKCVFANLYYEFNNERLDHFDREKSNLKCAIYGDVHTAGQQSYSTGNSLTYIQQSSGWASKDLLEPDVPEGYELVFGPLDGANNAPGYMGFAFLDKYDVDACARECNRRGADGNGGACQYFNIWRAVVSGVPTTYTCSMYFIVADASTAVNTGQGDLKVTFSRGYSRKNYLIDGGFEGYTECASFCFTESYTNWVASSPAGGYLDASVFYFKTYARNGHGSALLGSATFADDKSGTLSVAQPLKTEAGKKYQVAFFQNSAFSGPTFQAKSIVQVLWNGKVVETIKPGFTTWKFHSVDVVAVGNDILAFSGGSAPAWTFLDDISLWPLFQ
ncbi:hypothetical protein DFP72DRAFT_906001 [Ephemerocybe angulata]|uniref:Fruit-body specific protein a n=1 Tax=Ephemerocybe angulata TaxID=980116 RepID=A0A8H6HUL6_9AGAR|nr:hypothetical protein DFP72DRAFT_906001 [Tulosesus angulatus]